MTSGWCGGNCGRGCGDEGGTARFELVRVALVSLILFLSGCSALLFQTLWLRLSGLAFGNSVWSAALILSSFMAGLALGSAIAARLSLRRVRPLRVYAGLESIVAVFGCTLVFGLPLLGEWLRPIFQGLWHHQELLNILRFSISFLVLLHPFVCRIQLDRFLHHACRRPGRNWTRRSRCQRNPHRNAAKNNAASLAPGRDGDASILRFFSGTGSSRR